MGKVLTQHLPRGTHQSPKGNRIGCVGKSALCIFFLVWGILFFSFQSEAKSLSDGIPKDIIEYCDEIGEEYDICPELLESIAYYESRFIPTVKNKNCYGLMQVNVKVHADRIEKYDWAADDMLDAYKNIRVAADLLAELYQTYGDDNQLVLMYYSGNSDAVSDYKEYGFVPEYVEKVLNRSERYERLHKK